MGRDMLVDGTWEVDYEPKTDDSGAFHRWTSTFRDWIEDEPDARFQPEAGRYHLYICRSCPWAHGTALVRRLLGLEDVISMDMVDPVQYGEGWEFTPDKDGCTTDAIHGADSLHEVYTAADPNYTGRVTVPTLWDRKEETIVNNESIEIMRMFVDAFTALQTTDIELYPEGHREDIDEIIDDIYDTINNGVYRVGNATTQSAYDEAVVDLFATLDRYEEHLDDRRFLTGDRLTLADVRLFPTLVRFDEAYHTRFMCNRRRIEEYDNLWAYVRDVYQTPGVAETVNMDHIKQHYYTANTSVIANDVIPIGPDPDFEASHGRTELSTEASAPPE